MATDKPTYLDGFFAPPFIEDVSEAELPQRKVIRFLGGGGATVTAADDVLNEVTVVTIDASGSSGSVSSATSTTAGVLKLTNDLGGTADLPQVVGLRGRLISTTAPSDGDIYVYDAGSGQFVPSSQRGGLPLLVTPPAAASWTQIVAGDDFRDVPGGVVLRGDAAGGTNWRPYVRSAPATPYTIEAAFRHCPELANTSNAALFGMLFRESSSGKLHSLHFYLTGPGSYKVASAKWSAPNSFSADYVAGFAAAYSPLIFIRAIDDGSNRKLSYSFDGNTFWTFHSVTRTDFLTPNQVGWGVDPEALGSGVTLVHWKVS